MEQTSLDYTLKLYNIMLDDMINIFANNLWKMYLNQNLKRLRRKTLNINKLY